MNWEDGYCELELNANLWCRGFICGMQRVPGPWSQLDIDRPALLKPVFLFGTRRGLADWYRMHEWSPRLAAGWLERIAPMVVGIRDYWRPRG